MRLLFLFSLLSTSLTLSSQSFLYEDRVYVDHIRSVQFHLSDLVTSLPIVDLNSPARLRLAFDDILGGDIDYSYRIIHCDKDWSPSQLDESEYLDGFNNEEVQNSDYSLGTLLDYTHYELLLPNNDVRWRISGNYLLVITDEDADEVVLTRRFMVAERKVSLGLTVERAIQVANSYSNQELDITINNERFPISNPRGELFVSVLQNGRWDNAQHNLQPQFVVGDNIRFDQTRRCSFIAYNEFRGIDLRSLRSRGFGIASVEVSSDGIIMVSELQPRRRKQVYTDYPDLNGSYVIESLRDPNADVRAEYVDTYFALESADMIIDGEVYILGKFNDWQVQPNWVMDYDFDDGYYYGNGLLKQGYYDYQFAIRREDGSIDIEHFEGAHFSTNNDYQAIAYYRTPMARYDRIIAVGNVRSNF